MPHSSQMIAYSFLTGTLCLIAFVVGECVGWNRRNRY